MDKLQKPELLIPAGSLEVLKVAVDYGADAVYIGGKNYGLRAKAGNFTIEEMHEAADYVHAHGAKLYVTVNIFAHNEDIDGIKAYFHELKETGLEEKIDAFIISDPGIFTLAKEILPGIEIHVSTQANNTNYLIYDFWRKQGATRGRCLLSSYFTGRDANQGACTHPCRWKYAVVEEKRPGEYLPVEEDDRGTYIFNSKDLCMIEHIPDMIDAGINSFKVEGRMKTALYVAVVTRTYREAIDDYYTSKELYESKMEHYREEIAACTFRQFTTGFYYGKPNEETQIYDCNTYVKNRVNLGTVEEVTAAGELVIHQKNKFCVGDTIEVMAFDGENVDVEVLAIHDEHGTEMESAPHPKQLLCVKVSNSEKIRKGMIIRTRHCAA